MAKERASPPYNECDLVATSNRDNGLLLVKLKGHQLAPHLLQTSFANRETERKMDPTAGSRTSTKRDTTAAPSVSGARERERRKHSREFGADP